MAEESSTSNFPTTRKNSNVMAKFVEAGPGPLSDPEAATKLVEIASASLQLAFAAS
jgi:hypothetical protein